MKIFWMNTLHQLMKRLHPDPETPVMSTENTTLLTNQTKLTPEIMTSVKNSTNITWIPITKWSECSKPCGGGKSYMERICVLPTEDKAAECEGERIVSEDCNMEPCDDLNNELSKYKTNYSKLTSTIKSMQVSKRPWRYEKCIIKEGDLALYIDEGAIKGTKIPSHLILNNETLTLYSNDDFDSIILAYRLSSVTGIKHLSIDNANNCFEIQDDLKKSILCSFITTNDKSLKDVTQEWENDILDFIKNCEVSESKLNLVQINENSLGSNIQASLDFYKEHERENMEKIIIKTQQAALLALEKELKLENVVEKEEESRQIKIDKEYYKKLEEVKKQKEIIEKAINEKKSLSDLYSEKAKIKKKVKQIKDQVQNEIQKIRDDLKQRMLSLQKEKTRKRESVKNKIEETKKEISKKLIRASRRGNADECISRKTSEEMVKYCEVNYEHNIEKIKECSSRDNFYYLCCESEFGDLHLEERSACYSKCDDFLINNYEELKQIKNSEPEEKSSLKQTPDKSDNNESNESDKLFDEEKKKMLLLNIKSELGL
jgi:hypothetical protein